MIGEYVGTTVGIQKVVEVETAVPERITIEPRNGLWGHGTTCPC